MPEYEGNTDNNDNNDMQSSKTTPTSSSNLEDEENPPIATSEKILRNIQIKQQESHSYANGEIEEPNNVNELQDDISQ